MLSPRTTSFRRLFDYRQKRRPDLGGWPARPAARIAEIRDNLLDRIAKAGREGWLGEVDGLKVSLAGAEDKLAQIDRRAGRPGPVDLGVTIPVGSQQEDGTRHDD
jgi:hypothetical protein